MEKASFKTALKQAFQKVMHLRMYSSFRSFEKRFVNCYPERSFEKRERLAELGKRYGAVICGSDQVWNPDITDSDLSYFLDFCREGTRRISYAPSFGVESLSPVLMTAAGREISKFHAVSVREEAGQRLVSEMTGRKAPIVVDPTMLLSADEWAVAERPHPEAKGDYILYYTIRRSDSLMRFCKELSAKTGMKVVVAGGNFLKRLKNRDDAVRYAADASPEEWLYLVRNARYVVTNSFHGTAFSVIFRKDFYVELSSMTNSRLTHLTEMLSLEDRIVGKGAMSEISPADYTVAEEKLPMLCLASREYHEKALGGDAADG